MFREAHEDLWKLAATVKPDAVCITTNGFVKRNGEAVMGKGCALEAMKRWPGLPKVYGEVLQCFPLSVRVMVLPNQPYHLIAFPVKPREVSVALGRTNIVPHQRFAFAYRDIAPGWAAMALPELIEQSAKQLMSMIAEQSWTDVLLPRPGVGNGGLSWDEVVKPLLVGILDERVIVVSK